MERVREVPEEWEVDLREDPFSELAERYNSTGEILRQVVRHELVERGLSEHLPGPPASIVDVTGSRGRMRKFAGGCGSSRVPGSGRTRLSMGRRSTLCCVTAS